MRKVVFAVMALSAFSLVAAPSAEPAQFAKLSPEQREKMLRATGGFIESEAPGKYVRFVNAQQIAPMAAIEDSVKNMHTALRLPIHVDLGTAGARPSSYLDASNGVVVLVVDAADTPVLLTAPEDGWAQVNVRPLIVDKPAQDLLERRVKKELWRAFIYLLGGGNTSLPLCTMKPVVKLADLDEMKSLVSCPEPFGTVLIAAEKFGIYPIRRGTYRQAAIQGWAPPPVNEYQRAILEVAKKRRAELGIKEGEIKIPARPPLPR